MGGVIFPERRPPGNENYIGQEGHLKSDLGLNLYSATISSVIVVKLFKFQFHYLSMEKVIFVMPVHRVVYGLYGKKNVCVIAS